MSSAPTYHTQFEPLRNFNSATLIMNISALGLGAIFGFRETTVVPHHQHSCLW